MDARQVRTKEDAKCIVEERGLSHVKLGVTDIDGIMRGKYVSRSKFFSILEKGMSFCDVVLGWDSNDQLYDNVTYTGWHTAYPDAPVRIVPESCRDLPVEGDMLFFLAEFDEASRGDLSARPVAARARARRGRWATRSNPPSSSNSSSSRRRRARCARRAIATSSRSRPAISAIRCCAPRCMRISTPSSCANATRWACRSRACTPRPARASSRPRSHIRRRSRPPTGQRCSRPSPRCSRKSAAGWRASWPNGHRAGRARAAICTCRSSTARAKASSTTPRSRTRMSDMMRWFVGGQQALMPELLAMVASTVNSYRRLIPGFWAPTEASWGVENRTCALRVIPGSRVEPARRVPDRGRRHQSLRRARRRHRLGALRHREQDRAGRARRRQRLCAEISEETRLAAHIDRGGRAAQAIESRARALRRRLRRALRRDARMGGARVPPRHHGLGARPLFRDHLTARANTRTRLQGAAMAEIICVSPIDGREVARRKTASGAEIEAGASPRARGATPLGGGAARRTHRGRDARRRGARRDERGCRLRARPADGSAHPLWRRVPRRRGASAPHGVDRTGRARPDRARGEGGLSPHDQARAARPRPRHRALELPLSHRRQLDRAGADRRQRGDLEACGADDPRRRALPAGVRSGGPAEGPVHASRAEP